jgi:hypothetical protein
MPAATRDPEPECGSDEVADSQVRERADADVLVLFHVYEDAGLTGLGSRRAPGERYRLLTGRVGTMGSGGSNTMKFAITPVLPSGTRRGWSHAMRHGG